MVNIFNIFNIVLGLLMRTPIILAALTTVYKYYCLVVS